MTPLKTNMTLENRHVQWEIHLQMVVFQLVMLVFSGVDLTPRMLARHHQDGITFFRIGNPLQNLSLPLLENKDSHLESFSSPIFVMNL